MANAATPADVLLMNRLLSITGYLHISEWETYLYGLFRLWKIKIALLLRRSPLLLSHSKFGSNPFHER
jgi:hypothetical protein